MTIFNESVDPVYKTSLNDLFRNQTDSFSSLTHRWMDGWIDIYLSIYLSIWTKCIGTVYITQIFSVSQLICES